MENLSEEQLHHLESLLLARDRELRRDLQREVGEQADFADIASPIPDPGDASFADLSVDLGHAAVGRDLTELRAVRAALQKMKDGTYGNCGECGRLIPYGRLEVQPTAERCAPCQELFERTHSAGMRGGTL